MTSLSLLSNKPIIMSVLIALVFVAICQLVCKSTFAAATAIANDKEAQCKKLTIEVHFESYCPDSRNFFVSQLNPFVSSMDSTVNDLLDIQLYPFGKASIENSGSHNSKMICQHRERECVGNRIMGCILRGKFLSKRSTKLNNTQAINAITCMLKVANYNLYNEQCLSENNLSEALECEKSGEGQKIMEQMASKVEARKLRYVPSIYINDKRNEEAEYELSEQVCNEYKQLNNKNTNCNFDKVCKKSKDKKCNSKKPKCNRRRKQQS